MGLVGWRGECLLREFGGRQSAQDEEAQPVALLRAGLDTWSDSFPMAAMTLPQI